jgi:thiamine biosynthesis lipoprotein
MTATATFEAWSSTMRLAIDDDRALRPATEHLWALLARVEKAASRFHRESELSRANQLAGRPVPVSKLLVDLVGAALDAAADSDGAVDPTMGHALSGLGYDCDIREIRPDGPNVTAAPPPANWRQVRLDRRVGLLTVPRGTALDLGASAKAWTADRAATDLARRFDSAVYVELGGDIAVAGERPDGWCVRVAERDGSDGPLVLLRSGGLATSTTTIRRWRRGGYEMHHIVDPRTGSSATGPWRTASVSADSALAANTASTAAIVRGDAALDWLTERGFAARLVDHDGAVTTTAGWPAPRTLAATA